MKAEVRPNASECAHDLDLILEWARLAAYRALRHEAKCEEHRKTLSAQGEICSRLHEFEHWRESSAFTEREKAALNLSESMSSMQSETHTREALMEAKRHFNRSEMISLTRAVLAANDWVRAQSHSPAQVLVVEDDPEDRELLRWQLKKAKMEGNVIFAPDAPQAMTLLENYQNRTREGALIALFLDLRLPGMDGIELLRNIRAMPEMENLPVVVMTSSRDPRDMEECRKLKVMSYVEKPVTLGSFSKAVANIFHQA
jgi:CheY-like chemotaxis protein